MTAGVLLQTPPALPSRVQLFLLRRGTFKGWPILNMSEPSWTTDPSEREDKQCLGSSSSTCLAHAQ